MFCIKHKRGDARCPVLSAYIMPPGNPKKKKKQKITFPFVRPLFNVLYITQKRWGARCPVLSAYVMPPGNPKKHKKQKITYPLKGRGPTSSKYMYVHVLNPNRMPPYNLSRAVVANQNFWL